MFQPNKIIEVSDISRPFQVVSHIYHILFSRILSTTDVPGSSGPMID